MEFAQSNDALLNALQSGVVTVGVQFLQDRLPSEEAGSFGTKVYTYKVPAAWAVKVHDWLVVLPSNAFKTVRVVEVHPFPRTESQDGRSIKWAVQKIDPHFYFNIKQAEEQLQTTLHYMRKKAEAERLLEELKRTMPGDALESMVNTFASLIGGQHAQAPALAAQPVVSEQVAQSHASPLAQPTVATAPVAAQPETPVQGNIAAALAAQPQAQQPAQQWQPGAQKPSWAR